MLDCLSSSIVLGNKQKEHTLIDCLHRSGVLGNKRRNLLATRYFLAVALKMDNGDTAEHPPSLETIIGDGTYSWMLGFGDGGTLEETIPKW